jgi:LysM repeat protein
MASYEPGAAKSDITGSVQQTAAAKPGWNWEGGTAITVQKGDTIDGLVTRYGVPAAAIAEANNIPNGTALKPGQRLVIPKYEVTVDGGRACSTPPGIPASWLSCRARSPRTISRWMWSRPARP